ncbi:MAG TPA: Nramp family divalent metal transporter [Bacteroidia bacterium]|nr:Nramp family divalent metal transporter [Bacteroidia bacterium]
MSNHSLREVYASVDTTNKKTGWKKIIAFFGPAYLVSVGYMDPGNWATDIAGGSRFGYALLWVLVLSNLMALLLQSLSARLGIVSGLDLAQASRGEYPKRMNFFLWVLAEIAIAACDLAEVIGMAIGLQLLFGLPLMWGVLITVFDTLLLLMLQRFGIRKMEALIIGLISVIGLAFIIELFYSKPDAGEIFAGLKPSLPGGAALYIAIGIIGATVMPHNLYLHSSLVQTRKIRRTREAIRQAIRLNVFDSAIALNLALFVNAAILILAGATFFSRGIYNVESIHSAHQLLSGLLGSKLAPALFAIALIAAGQSSTLTGTLSGQIVMEGYLNIRLQPWMRRLITRLLAIIPAIITLLIAGEKGTEDLLILSQVILSLQLGFAVIPLIHFVRSKKLMGEFRAPLSAIIPAWICAALIVVLNGKLVMEFTQDLLHKSAHPVIIWLTLVPVILLCAFILLWITVRPFIRKKHETILSDPHEAPVSFEFTPPSRYKKIAVCVDFSSSDSIAISQATRNGGQEAVYFLIHITETAGARVMNEETGDMETQYDEQMLNEYTDRLQKEGYHVETQLGYGNPKERIPEVVNGSGSDLLVMGAHGHNLIKDLLFGTTVNAVRHRVDIPVLVVKKEKK